MPSFISCGGLGDALDNCPGPSLKYILHHEPRIKVKIFSRETPISEKMPTCKKLSVHSRAKNYLPRTPISVKGALNPNFLHLIINREKNLLEIRFGPTS